jgi:hypothetical protein
VSRGLKSLALEIGLGERQSHKMALRISRGKNSSFQGGVSIRNVERKEVRKVCSELD